MVWFDKFFQQCFPKHWVNDVGERKESGKKKSLLGKKHPVVPGRKKGG